MLAQSSSMQAIISLDKMIAESMNGCDDDDDDVDVDDDNISLGEESELMVCDMLLYIV